MTAKRGPLGEKGGRNEGLTNVSAAETGKKIREGLKKKCTGHGDYMEMGHKKEKNISGSRNLAVWMLLPLKKSWGIKK